MATTISIKQLANGQLPSSIGDLYTVPAATTTLVKSVTLVNTNTTTEAVNLYVLKASGTARSIIPKPTSLASGFLLVMDDLVTLETGDKIQGDSTTSGKVDFVVSGVQES